MSFKYSNGQNIDQNTRYIDLKSDTVTKPTKTMFEAMFSAPIGDDVFHEDPTVIELEQQVSKLTGKKAGLFFPTGTQSNLVAVLSSCGRGDKILVGDQYHINTAEGMGVSIYGGVGIDPLPTKKDGSIIIENIENKISPGDLYTAKARLVCCENTVSGLVQDQHQLDTICELANKHNLLTHLDGARLFNAYVKTGLSIKSMVDKFDSVSICLSKGLGAPIGSVLVGSEKLIMKAERIRKNLGGGMRQAGIIAAAGIYAINHNINRLKEDHNNAKLLANGLSSISQIEVIYPPNQTNMVFFHCDTKHSKPLKEFLFKRNILIGEIGHNSRLVCHLDIDKNDVKYVINSFNSYFNDH